MRHRFFRVFGPTDDDFVPGFRPEEDARTPVPWEVPALGAAASTETFARGVFVFAAGPEGSAVARGRVSWGSHASEARVGPTPSERARGCSGAARARYAARSPTSTKPEGVRTAIGAVDSPCARKVMMSDAAAGATTLPPRVVGVPLALSTIDPCGPSPYETLSRRIPKYPPRDGNPVKPTAT